MYWEDAIELINKAYAKDFENKAWEMWLTLYPNMDKKNFTSFEDYKKKIIRTPQINQANSSVDEILKDVSEIRSKKARKEGF
ncbi:MAG: hypothetical protein ACRDDM_12035 [Paraclostridium sp.]